MPKRSKTRRAGSKPRSSNFKVDARVREINPGPAVTQFTLEPGAGTKVKRITELQNDLALALAAPSIRIEAPIPGKARLGIEIPNDQIATVGLRESIESSAFNDSRAKLPLPLGRDVNGRYVVGDLAKMPHLLIAGSTGSGKSVCLNGIISTFCSKCSRANSRWSWSTRKWSKWPGIPACRICSVRSSPKWTRWCRSFACA
ncbi:MAG: DNA translocase FtsK [Thermomicrobiales bacterium]